MILSILLIYFILLIILEFYFILISGKSKNTIYKKTNINIEKFNFKSNELKLEKTNEDLDIKNYVGKFVIINTYGYFIYINNWNLLEQNILYEFIFPVNIKIIKINKNQSIDYYIN